MKYYFIFMFLVLFNSLNAQQFKRVYEYDLDQSFATLLNNELTKFEISNSGDHLMMLTNEYVKTLDKEGNLIFEYQCVPKTNSKSSLASDLIGGEVGRMISNIRLDEGNGFWLFEEENLIIILDWNLKKNKIMGYDLSTGEKLWETEKHRYAPAKNFFTSLDKSTGEITAGPVKVKQPLIIDNRKPWLFSTEDQLVHNGKRLYFLDKHTLEEEKKIKLKKAKIGDIKAMDLMPSGFIMLGEKGAAFYDKKGNFKSNIKIKDVERALWTDKYMLIITKGNLFKPGNVHIINIKIQKQVDEMKVSDLTIFSKGLDCMVKASKDLKTRLEFYQI